MGDLLYVGWGASRGAGALREAVERARGANHGLVYLAVLDGRFADIDDGLLDAIEHELLWLADAQLRLVRQELAAMSVDTRVVVRRGNVLDAVARMSGETDVTGILVAAPLPGDGRMVRRIADVTDLPVTVMEG
jgi:hypothetical protein